MLCRMKDKHCSAPPPPPTKCVLYPGPTPLSFPSNQYPNVSTPSPLPLRKYSRYDIG